MLYFDIDARDGGPAGGAACNTCCCHPIMLRPGETNLVAINYAPWSLPIAPPGIVTGTEIAVTIDNAACPNNEIEGFTYPSNTNYTLSTPVSTALEIDLSANAAPLGNEFTYALVSLQGPTNGSIAQTGTAAGPTFTYTPNGGYTGYDYFTYEMTDGQGRTVVRTVEISVGQHFAKRDRARMATGPFVDMTKINVDRRMQIVKFPIYMPLSVRDCQTFRMTLKQPAKDCDQNTYHHFACFDIRSGDCS